MPCNPLIADPFVFPRRADNRAGLAHIAYRIGRYADFVEAMTRGIDAAPELAAWTHRDADDPGIALLQGAALNRPGTLRLPAVPRGCCCKERPSDPLALLHAPWANQSGQGRSH